MSYITPTDIYNEGVDPTEFPAPVVQAAIDLWQEFIEHACGQWFESRAVEVLLDGTGCSTLWFQVPIVSLSKLWINGDFDNEFPIDNVTVYNGATGLRDDRKNPKIVLVGEGDVSFYSRPLYPNEIFAIGPMNQKIKGNFGYIDNGATPNRIKFALKKLVINNLGKLAEPGSGTGIDPIAALVNKEVTDGHSIEYASLWGSTGPKKLDYLDVVRDPVVNGILKMFKAPRVVKMVYSTVLDPEQ